MIVSLRRLRFRDMSIRTWRASAIAAGLILAALLAGRGRDARLPAFKTQHSQPAVRVPQTSVVITDEGKTFHVPTCSYIAEEAVREGYVPCVRCEPALVEK